MIRLRPTTLAIGRSDLEEYDERRRTRSARRSSDHLVNKLGPWEALGGSTAGFDKGDKPTSRTDALFSIGGNCETGTDSYCHTLAIQTVSLPGSCKLINRSNTPLEVSAPGVADDASVDISLSKDPPSRLTETVYNNSFFQNPGEQVVGLVRSSTSYSPNETPTPSSLHSSESRRPRTRRPLSRSPLFIAQNASKSPEHRPTSSLTPRVASRVATHHTPGIIFSQPPRRPGPKPQHEFRHQANSFSFDSSERSSAAYEQGRVSSSSTESARRTSVGLSLHEELQAIALQGSSAPSNSSPSPSNTARAAPSTIPCQREPGAISEHGEVALGSHPQLTLPSPFSVQPRSSSNPESLPNSAVKPSLEYLPSSSHNSSSGPDIPQREISDGATPDQVDTNPNSQILNRSASTSHSPASLIRLAGRVLSACKARTASTTHSPSNSSIPSISPTSHQLRPSQSSNHPQTPTRNYHVYNDAISPHSQPRTSADLPESRHQSRFHGSYTAPISRINASSNSAGINSRGQTFRQVHHTLWMTPSRMPGRTNSPVGLSTPGFHGLYGGRENGDDEGNWAEGVHLTSTSSSGLDLESARVPEGDMRQTPEADDWRVERR